MPNNALVTASGTPSNARLSLAFQHATSVPGLVSAVIPTYNRAYCVARAIDSVLTQQYAEVEAVVVDDGSTDGTRELIAQRYADEPRVRYITQTNQGVSTARNHGFEAARGEFIGLLDSDDYWHPWKTTAQVAVLRARAEVGMVWSDMEAMYAQGEIFDRRHLRHAYDAYQYFRDDELFETNTTLGKLDPSAAAAINTQGQSSSDFPVRLGNLYSAMIMGSLVHTSTVLLRRSRLEQVGGFDPELRHLGEDYDFHLRTCRVGPVALLDASSIIYTRGSADRLTRHEHRIHAALNFLKVVERELREHRAEIRLPERMIHEVLSYAHAWVGDAAWNAGEVRLARRHLAESLRHRPGQRGIWLRWLASWLPGARGLQQLYRRGKRALRNQPDDRFRGEAISVATPESSSATTENSASSNRRSDLLASN